jgi:hypothetical protein
MKITNLEKIAATGELNNQFVGVKISNNKIEFHYPETYQLSDNDDELRRDILSVLRTISLAKTLTSNLSSYNSKFNNNDVFPIGAYLWIINDYLTYGRYENREKTYQHGARGKIDWRRTLRTSPAISSGNVIYTDIISEKKSQVDNLLTEIYFFCAKRSCDALGWLYGTSFEENGVDYEKKFNKKLYLATINTELSHTFDDIKKTRLQHMKNVITGLDDDILRTREFVYGVDSYDYVYERMVDSMFSNIDNIKEFYPTAEWDLIVEDRPKDSSKLRPDTVLEQQLEDGKKNLYILDAKYYRYGTTFLTKHIPETTSIQKQITYGEYVKMMKPGVYEEIYSAFVMPYSRTTNIHKDRFNKDIEFIGVARAKWIDASGETSRNIAGILLDTKFLINNWVRKNTDNINEMIEIIEDNIQGVLRE